MMLPHETVDSHHQFSQLVMKHSWLAPIEGKARNANITNRKEFENACNWVHEIIAERIPETEHQIIAACHLGRLLADH